MTAERATGSLDIVFFGLSITSAWGNAHAGVYRGLVRELTRRSHRVLFLERDLPRPPCGRTELYRSLEELHERFVDEVARADVVILGSFVPDGCQVAAWVLSTASGVVAFYDIDTPVTLSRLMRGVNEYVSRELVPRFDVYLSLAGGPTLARLEREYGARRAVALHSAVDPDEFPPAAGKPPGTDLGYVGTFSADRQQAIERFLVAPARRMPERRFAIAGTSYPPGVDWPPNLTRIEHLPLRAHGSFYASLRFALNLTRSDMVGTGFAPSRRLFEAAASGTPVMTDRWPGLDSFFRPGSEILVVETTEQVEGILRELGEEERRAIGERARQVVLERHTTVQRAAELERVIAERRDARSRQRTRLAHAFGGTP